MSAMTNSLTDSHRERLSRLGILTEPAGYVDGASLYEYVQSNPTGFVDPSGLRAEFILDAQDKIQVDRVPGGFGLDGKVDQEFVFQAEVRKINQGKFCFELHIKATLTVRMWVLSEKRGLVGDLRDKVIAHEYTHYNTYVDGFWPQIKRLGWFDGKRFLTEDKAKLAAAKLEAHVQAYYIKAQAHSISFDPFRPRRGDQLVRYNERPFNEKLVTNDIPLDE